MVFVILQIKCAATTFNLFSVELQLFVYFHNDSFLNRCHGNQ